MATLDPVRAISYTATTSATGTTPPDVELLTGIADRFWWPQDVGVSGQVQVNDPNENQYLIRFGSRDAAPILFAHSAGSAVEYIGDFDAVYITLLPQNESAQAGQVTSTQFFVSRGARVRYADAQTYSSDASNNG